MSSMSGIAPRGFGCFESLLPFAPDAHGIDGLRRQDGIDGDQQLTINIA